MSALPKGWSEVELGEVFGRKRGSALAPAKQPDRRFELYSVPAFKTGRPERPLGAEVGSSKQAVLPGTVLLCRINPRINRVWIVGERTDDPQVASTEWIALRRVEGVAPRFLMYALRAPAARGHLTSSVSGVGGSLMRVRMAAAWQTRVPLAPLPEQRRIVARIESLFAKLDEGVAALKRAEANLERYRASVLKSAVEGRLTEHWRRENPPEETGEELLRRILAERRKRWKAEQLAKFEAKGKNPPKNWRAKYKEPVAPDTSGLPGLPEGWCWATVDQVVWAMMNGYGKRSDTPGGTPRMVLRLADIRHDQISYQSPRYLDCTSQQIAKYRLAERDVLIVRVNGSADLVGRMVDCRNTNGDVLFCDHFIRAKCTTLVSAAWLRLCSKTERFRSHVERIRVSTAGQHTVSQGVILPFALPLPPEKEVLAILALADYLHSQSKPVESALADGRVNASAFRQSILKRAFEGGLVPQDPADEPASALLERIRADREAERKRRKRRRTKPRRQRRRRVP